MTAYLVLRDHRLEPGEEGFEIEISTADVEDLRQRVALNQSVVAVEAGEVLSERQAPEALLLPSANNVAALLAVHEAGSVEAFVAEMNEAVAELGMLKTHYTDPSGFEDTTVSTAADQVKLGRAGWPTQPSPKSSPCPRPSCRSPANSPTSTNWSTTKASSASRPALTTRPAAASSSPSGSTSAAAP
jgi:D-alanyl-D-alanine carboxypeptidase